MCIRDRYPGVCVARTCAWHGESPALVANEVVELHSTHGFCARFQDGGIRCWGRDHGYPARGAIGSCNYRCEPAPLLHQRGGAEVHASRLHATWPYCFSSDGSVRCYDGQRGSMAATTVHAAFGAERFWRTETLACALFSSMGLLACGELSSDAWTRHILTSPPTSAVVGSRSALFWFNDGPTRQLAIPRSDSVEESEDIRRLFQTPNSLAGSWSYYPCTRAGVSRFTCWEPNYEDDVSVKIDFAR